MVQVEMNNMYINIGANNGGEKLWTKNTATSGKLINSDEWRRTTSTYTNQRKAMKIYCTTTPYVTDRGDKKF